MINLLPPDVKESVTFARRNTHLLHWSVAMAIGLVVILAISVFGQLYLNQTIKSSSQQLADAQAQLKLQKVEETQKRVEQMSSSLKLVVQVLSKEVLFSKLLTQIGSVMPQNTVLTNLSINKLQGGIDLQASAVDYQSATQVQVNLSDKSNKIFSSADLVNIQCNENSSSDTSGGSTSASKSKYPCSVTVRAQFAVNNPFLLINNGSTK